MIECNNVAQETAVRRVRLFAATPLLVGFADGSLLIAGFHQPGNYTVMLLSEI